MHRESPKERKNRKKKRQGIALAAAALVILTVLAGVFIREIIEHEQLDAKTLCPSESGPHSFWAVVIDGTDSYSRLQWQDIENRFQNIKRRVPRHGMLAVFTVPEKPSSALEPEVAICNPGSGENLSVWTGNPELARRKWEEEFNAPLDSIFGSLEEEGALPRSPIMETITAVKIASDSVVGSFSQSDQGDVSRHLFLVSDMMQHTSRYSHYTGDVPSIETLKSIRSARDLSTDLSGWKVTIYYAWRDDEASSRVQGRGHIEFWNAYLHDMAGVKADTSLRVVTIEG